MRLDGISGVRGSDSNEEVSPSSLKKRSWLRLAINFSSEVSSWFIDDSSKETSSVSSSDSSEESSPPSSLESHNLFLTAEDSTSCSNVIVIGGHCWRRESVEKERGIGCTRESDRPLWFI
jgi:hypothetical protein